MKIAFAANTSWYLKNFRYNTIKIFSSKYETVATFSPKVKENYSVFEDLRVSERNFNMEPAGKNYLKELISLISVTISYYRYKPDLIFSFNPKVNLYTLIFSAISNTPVVINVSGVGAASQLSGVKGLAYKFFLKRFYNKASHIFFQNSEDMQDFIAKGICDGTNHEVLPGSGVDLAKFKPSFSSFREKKFLMASRLIKQKGVIEFLESAKHIINNENKIKAQFYIAGIVDESSRAVSEKEIYSYCTEGYIDYLGNCSNVAEVLQNIDIVVLPSYYPEGTPRSLLEAAAAGKVIITTDTPGCRDVVIEGVNGFLVPPRDTEALRKAMEKVINLSDEKLAEMQTNSRKLAEDKFDEQYVIQRYLDVAEVVLSKKSEK